MLAALATLQVCQLLGEVIVRDWQAAGLLKPSAIKPVITTIERSLVIRIMGQLRDNDRIALQERLKVILG